MKERGNYFYIILNICLISVSGVERVIKGKRQYAFLMESTSIEYRMERSCELDKIGGLIDNKGYGIAMPRSECTEKF